MIGWVHFKLYGKFIGVMYAGRATYFEVRAYAHLLAKRRGVDPRDVKICDGPGTLPADEDEPVQHTTMWKRFNQNSDKRKGA